MRQIDGRQPPERVGWDEDDRRGRRRRRPIGCLLIACLVSACGGRATITPSEAVQRHVAERFAAAVLHGDAAGARALLAHPDEEALLFLVERAATPWRGQQASIRLPARRNGNRWAVSYTGTRARKDGRFERERGDLVVLVAPSRRGANVAFFAFRNVHIRFSTHHDAQLLPSNR